MSFDAIESSTYSSAPFELYWFSMAPVQGAVQNWYLCSSEIQRTHDGNIYEPTIISRTESNKDNELQSGSISVTIPNEHPVSQLFAKGLALAPIALTIFAGHDGDDDVAVVFSGRLANAIASTETKINCLTDEASMKKKIPACVYESTCSRALYSPGCAVPLNGSTDSMFPTNWNVTVSDISPDKKTLTISGTDFDAFWSSHFGDTSYALALSWGLVLAGTGASAMVVAHPVRNQVVLLEPVSGLSVGDTLTVYRGCNGTWQSCRGFNRAAVGSGYVRTPRFMGFDKIPQKNPFNGVS